MIVEIQNEAQMSHPERDRITQDLRSAAKDSKGKELIARMLEDASSRREAGMDRAMFAAEKKVISERAVANVRREQHIWNLDRATQLAQEQGQAAEAAQAPAPEPLDRLTLERTPCLLAAATT